ncbi:alpha/beta fold hydrolase, partial [bacterium]|nr:alpha/beta fold hydrolase [bacterium]
MSTSIETLEFNNHEGEALWSQFSRTDDAQGTLVFFHGFPGSSDYIVSQRMKDFSRNSYNVLRLDFSGSGRSKGKFENKTMTKEAKEVITAFEFATKLTPNLPVSLVGHSTGAIDVALSFSHFPSTLLEQIHSVILLGGVSDLKKGISYDFSE